MKYNSGVDPGRIGADPPGETCLAEPTEVVLELVDLVVSRAAVGLHHESIVNLSARVRRERAQKERRAVATAEKHPPYCGCPRRGCARPRALR